MTCELMVTSADRDFVAVRMRFVPNDEWLSEMVLSITEYESLRDALRRGETESFRLIVEEHAFRKALQEKRCWRC